MAGSKQQQQLSTTFFSFHSILPLLDNLRLAQGVVAMVVAATTAAKDGYIALISRPRMT